MLSAAARNLSLCMRSTLSPPAYPRGAMAEHCAASASSTTRTATLAAMSETVAKAPADGFVSPFPATRFDAILVVSFGGPEGMDDVIPFLENVTRGRNVPRERLEEVAHHYELFGGVSPINAQNRALIAALASELDTHGIDLPIYFGNRNWDPFLTDALREMAGDGSRARARVLHVRLLVVLRAAASIARTSSTPSRRSAPGAPEVVKTRMFFNHPGLDRGQCRSRARPRSRRWAAGSDVHLAFTAHSIPRRDGAGVPLRGSAAGVGAARGGGRRSDRHRARLPEPERPAAGAVARARHPRPSPRRRGARRHGRRRSRRSASSPITSRCCSTSTSRPSRPPPSSG